ncbi:MAG: biopolymer transporter ExbD [Saprospiraceae bacterium]|jgi:biopolymer transport protein ExbD|uniref:Biopolymer transporter ExbD n=1 Tax=Candidatus Defluviibacterium haderslevense TaxID=2981993 RepID=A0A9D7SCB0_9BACT|nr:biopolymer transporter ExbD [Candidatus Defluviibacterium haderslevense]MCC7027187.1 biopolymer transporter ExbD [Saprospiraceae bacterium]MBK7245217.1 biopolymer transporter ExbD [Candidatus Defluviibacterium haderslevense]MBK8243699.1 biopolymer transporter ExbD [Candidatus Defluviibacterium haderslevense]MBK9718564.1 biopolymer transporter ExbD [Candidatus Defluviibacterium haderslevense]
MPKVKIPRKSTAIDMTAMCDVAFLLLTFFILTTKFRAAEVVQIDIPSSTARIPIPDKDIMMFNIAPDGRIFFGLDDQITRLKLLDRLATQYQLTFTPKQKDAFRTLELWGMDIRALPAFLDKEPNERASIQQPGLKIDTTGGAQIEDLILFSRQENNLLRIAIKGDKTTEYKSFDKLIEALQNRKVNKFNIITSARAAKE